MLDLTLLLCVPVQGQSAVLLQLAYQYCCSSQAALLPSQSRLASTKHSCPDAPSHLNVSPLGCPAGFEKPVILTARLAGLVPQIL